MKKITNIRNALSHKPYSLSGKHIPLMALMLIVLMILTGSVHADESTSAVDHLKNVKPGVKSTFGHGSTFEWLAYIAEGVVCLWRYLSTQNVAWFVGMPVVMVFTYAFLN